MRLHPYAIILGLVLGVFVLFTLRHPPFALLTAVIGVLGFDMAFKAKAKKLEDNDSDKDNKQ